LTSVILFSIRVLFSVEIKCLGTKKTTKIFTAKQKFIISGHKMLIFIYKSVNISVRRKIDLKGGNKLNGSPSAHVAEKCP